jgi:Domain of unknown function (DUF4263)
VHGDRLRITYRMREAAPPAMEWPEYAARVNAEWAQLLATDPAEPEVQRFLEQHPAMVPGAHSALGRMKSGHAPFPSALITQPSLRGMLERTPDFLWISTDSAFLNPVFIEIEAPGKPWLTAKGIPHHKLTQALHQVAEWEEWFDQPVNRQLFFELYQLPDALRKRKWAPIWVLIYGRRAENAEAIGKLRARLRTQSRIVIPYEHIEPDEDAADYLCVKQSRGRYVAVTVPPTAHVGPQPAEYWARIDGKPQAAQRNTWMSPERQAFLAERFDYWDAWTNAGETSAGSPIASSSQHDRTANDWSRIPLCARCSGYRLRATGIAGGSG